MTLNFTVKYDLNLEEKHITQVLPKLAHRRSNTFGESYYMEDVINEAKNQGLIDIPEGYILGDCDLLIVDRSSEEIKYTIS
jgi:hypothetical protein